MTGGAFVGLASLVRDHGVPGPFGVGGGAWLMLLITGGSLAIWAALVSFILPERAELDVLLSRIAHILGPPTLALGIVSWSLFGLFLTYVLAPGWTLPFESVARRVITTPTAFALTAAGAGALAIAGLSAIAFTSSRGTRERRRRDALPLVAGAAMAFAPWAAFMLIES